MSIRMLFLELRARRAEPETKATRVKFVAQSQHEAQVRTRYATLIRFSVLVVGTSKCQQIIGRTPC